MKSQFTKKRLKKFLSYYRPYRNIFVMDMFFAALSAIATLLFPLLSGYITGQVLSEWTGQTEKRLILAGIGLLVLLIIRVTSNVIYAYFGHAMGAKMEADMRACIQSALLNLRYEQTESLKKFAYKSQKTC
ncbi:MAG: ABC transporter transmembrane domain-containing protein [Lacrimispora saccharolytica]